MKLNKFKVEKLHGLFDYELEFKDNTLILIGENGSCKTTLMKVLFYFLTQQWTKLAIYDFSSVAVTVDNETISLNKTDIDVDRGSEYPYLRRMPSRIYHEIMLMRDTGVDVDRLEMIGDRYGIPVSYLMNAVLPNEKAKNKKHFLKVKEWLLKRMQDVYFIYLPTYRRIEQELKVVLNGRLDEDDISSYKRIQHQSNFPNFMEMIEFGMSDVETAIVETLDSLKDFFRSNLTSLTLDYFGEIVEQEYQNVNLSLLGDVDEETIKHILNRVDETILSDENKNHLSTTIMSIKYKDAKELKDHDKVVCHYFIKLLESHRKLEDKENKIRDFVDVCSRYLQNKQIIYNNADFSFHIKTLGDNRDIKLSQLSSGEKQVVSLFSTLYLNERMQYFVIIDEPELSLSVKWQKQFLVDVRKGEFCNGVFAITHSPFIFANELDCYAHGMDEFKE